MKKIKYQGGLTKLITSEIGKQNKIRFAQYIDSNLIALRKNIKCQPIEMEVVSFSSDRDFYDQVLSILSFIRYLGVPLSWTLYSDGSHKSQQVQILEESFEFLKVVMYDWEGSRDLPKECKESLLPYQSQFLDYALKVPLGKRLFYYLNHKINFPTLFLDADVIFYSKASALKMVLSEKVNGWFLPDADWGCLDSRYKKETPEQLYQINGGFFLFNRELNNLTEGLNFLKELNFNYEYFSDQNVFHIIFRNNGFLPLDPRIFIINTGDQFDFSYVYPREEIAIRHYTGPVRHKMWQRDWKWHLSL
jgi:hypothetical protein